MQRDTNRASPGSLVLITGCFRGRFQHLVAICDREKTNDSMFTAETNQDSIGAAARELSHPS